MTNPAPMPIANRQPPIPAPNPRRSPARPPPISTTAASSSTNISPPTLPKPSSHRNWPTPPGVLTAFRYSKPRSSTALPTLPPGKPLSTSTSSTLTAPSPLSACTASGLPPIPESARQTSPNPIRSPFQEEATSSRPPPPWNFINTKAFPTIRLHLGSFFQKRKGCGARHQASKKPFRAALRFVRCFQESRATSSMCSSICRQLPVLPAPFGNRGRRMSPASIPIPKPRPFVHNGEYEVVCAPPGAWI